VEIDSTPVEISVSSQFKLWLDEISSFLDGTEMLELSVISNCEDDTQKDTYYIVDINPASFYVSQDDVILLRELVISKLESLQSNGLNEDKSNNAIEKKDSKCEDVVSVVNSNNKLRSKNRKLKEKLKHYKRSRNQPEEINSEQLEMLKRGRKICNLIILFVLLVLIVFWIIFVFTRSVKSSKRQQTFKFTGYTEQ